MCFIIFILIMRLYPSLLNGLTTSSVAIILFSGMVSFFFKASNAETLGLTAAYAAVLVVFVGTNS